ncbi:polyprenyl synthetase family protein [Modestobacter sp. I12A-02628]|uniref:Polyprenyl synthetase family protein n=1 Tax=Goekera deserti TaxID=2497753 RepID=A0A7K3W8L5_9ACTN|nr:polyprenyl synthetase family protein [Goekera deserti]MPR00566.1 polyprenyl synthetase family protein [Goekera deserti]NDI50547.1 polyprenyl synthetase family protein [Goekera deserti]NEL52808.1 polyprenyl synthetase family protein [Goekera deserti]
MTGNAAAAAHDATEGTTQLWHRTAPPASTIGPWLPDGELGDALSDALGVVESALESAVTSEHAFVTEAAGHLMLAGGKRFRPLLTLLAAQLGDPHAPGVVPAAVVVELTHLATLYHDDVMDEADLRRGAPSANSRWGNSIAILAGDFLFARASDLLADLGPEAVRIQARTFERLVTGQIRETVGATPGEDPVAHYLAVLGDKTGSLVATSARFGASFAGAPAALVEELTAFGEDVGIAFQLSDDLLDIVSQGGTSGKAPGTDLREGIATLPALLALAGTDPAEARLRELVARPVTDDAEHAEALALLRGSASLARATRMLEEYAGRARARLTALPDGEVRDALSALCDYVVTRSS